MSNLNSSKFPLTEEIVMKRIQELIKELPNNPCPKIEEETIGNLKERVAELIQVLIAVEYQLKLIQGKISLSGDTRLSNARVLIDQELENIDREMKIQLTLWHSVYP